LSQTPPKKKAKKSLPKPTKEKKPRTPKATNKKKLTPKKKKGLNFCYACKLIFIRLYESCNKRNIETSLLKFLHKFSFENWVSW
jgi:hypothetical protein